MEDIGGTLEAPEKPKRYTKQKQAEAQLDTNANDAAPISPTIYSTAQRQDSIYHDAYGQDDLSGDSERRFR